jgi:hypothetical protein
LELDFAARYGSGMFLGHGFVYPLGSSASEPQTQQLKAFDRRQSQHDKQIRALMEEEMRSSGRTAAQIDEYFASTESLERLVSLQQQAYAGWLVTNPAFHAASDHFRRRWPGRFKEGLPTLPMSFFGTSMSSGPKESREFYADYSLLYRTWSIASLLTWELPIPIEPQLASGGIYNLDQVSSAGIVLFVPWYLLRDRKLTIESLAAKQRTFSSPNHLSRWLDGQPKNLGVRRYAIMLRLYICLELVLRRRYAERLSNKLETFDRAFAQFLQQEPRQTGRSESGEESIRKLRLEMARRLRQPLSD